MKLILIFTYLEELFHFFTYNSFIAAEPKILYFGVDRFYLSLTLTFSSKQKAINGNYYILFVFAASSSNNPLY